MNREHAAVRLGLLGALGVLVATGFPYVLAPGSATGVYYTGGYGGPPLIALFGVLASIVLLAGYKRRADPALSAGIVTVFGVFMLVLSLAWAAAADPAAIGGFTDNTLYRYHPWTLPATSGIVLVAGAWYARIVL